MALEYCGKMSGCVRVEAREDGSTLLSVQTGFTEDSGRRSFRYVDNPVVAAAEHLAVYAARDYNRKQVTYRDPKKRPVPLRHLLGDPCAYCGAPGPHGADHIDPAGDSTWENLTAACLPCNRSKQARPLLLYLAKRNGYTQDVPPGHSVSLSPPQGQVTTL